MAPVPGDMVIHADFGQGKVLQVLGGTSVVEFFGDALDVSTDDLTLIQTSATEVVDETDNDRPQEIASFRRSFEAINLGVVPPDPEQLIELTIGSKAVQSRIKKWLSSARAEGLCKAVFGYYGAGKSHMLKMVRCMALQKGWAVAYVEFDPKAADPAKPHLVYQNLMAALEFPERKCGSRSEGFMGFVKEVRDHWGAKNIRNNKIFKSSPWFSTAFEILLKHPHFPDMPDYRDACLWLSGAHNSFKQINTLAREKGLKIRVPRMPVTKESSEIYVFHLVVINELCKLLGYRGLMIILDEAEHVRGFNVRRRERANNLFDYLARSAHKPDPDDDLPALNEHGLALPHYWNTGPHFGLFVGLTEADTFADETMSLRDACVFLRTEEDRVRLFNPSKSEYRDWCDGFLKRFCEAYPLKTSLLESKKNRLQVVTCLESAYPSSADGVTLRNLLKLASLVPCILLSHPETTLEELIEHLHNTTADYFGNALPWE